MIPNYQKTKNRGDGSTNQPKQPTLDIVSTKFEDIPKRAKEFVVGASNTTKTKLRKIYRQVLYLYDNFNKNKQNRLEELKKDLSVLKVMLVYYRAKDSKKIPESLISIVDQVEKELEKNGKAAEELVEKLYHFWQAIIAYSASTSGRGDKK